MPNPPTTYMLLVTPEDHDDDNAWGGILNTAFGRVDSHRHITGEGQRVPVDGLNMDKDLDFADAHGITSAIYLELTNGAALTNGAYQVFVTAGNLHFRNATQNVRITNGNQLDVTTVGAIAGDYSSVGAEVAYVDASDSYTFKQQVGAAVRQYAKLEAADLHLFEYKAHPAAAPPTNFIALRSPAALPASYTMTLPGALPGSTQLQQMSAAGVISWSNTIANAVTLSALLTANAGITLAANQHVTVSGTGKYKRAGNQRVVSPYSGTGTAYTLTAGVGYVLSTGATSWFLPIPMDVGEQLTTVDVRIFGNSVANVTINIMKYTGGLAATNLGFVVLAIPAAVWVPTTINVADTTITDGDVIVAEYTPDAAGIRIGPLSATIGVP